MNIADRLPKNETERVITWVKSRKFEADAPILTFRAHGWQGTKRDFTLYFTEEAQELRIALISSSLSKYTSMDNLQNLILDVMQFAMSITLDVRCWEVLYGHQYS